MRKFAWALCLGLLPLAASADDGGFFIRPAIEGAIEFGGDTLGTVLFSNGETQDIKAGQGVSVAGGLHLRPYRQSHLDVRALVGYKYVSTRANNADIHVDRVTLELLPAYRFDGLWWAGAGLVKHSSIRLNADGFAPNVHFNSKVGAELQLGWSFLALTYTSLKYQDDAGRSYDASNIGLRISSAFGDNCCKDRRNSEYRPPVQRPAPVEQAPAVPPPPAAAPPGAASAVTLPQARLRGRPVLVDPGATLLTAGTVVSLQKTFVNEQGNWCYVTLPASEGGGSGWLLAEEIGSAPAVSPDATAQ